MRTARKTILSLAIFFLLLIDAQGLLAQSKMRKLPRNLNQYGINLFAPAVSGDGNVMVFLSDYTDSEEGLTMNFTYKLSMARWKDAQELTRLINRPTLNFMGGYNLDYEGNTLYFTSRKSGGMGGFDIWYSERSGGNWSAPLNYGAPLNSAKQDGCPSVSSDGEFMYFMRCDKMDNKNAEGCRIMYAERKGKTWKEPQELPANINTGNSQSPRILADGESLIFASDQFGGKGALDLLITKKEGDGWSDPELLEFLNTEKNDRFVSVPSKGRYAIISRKGDRFYELIEVLIPEEFKPKSVVQLKGTVGNQYGEPMPATVKAYNIPDRERIWYGSSEDDGSFLTMLKEGTAYDFSIEAKEPGYSYYSEVLDLRSMKSSTRKALEIELRPLQIGDTLEINGIMFEPQSEQISDLSTYELRRLTRLIKGFSDASFEIVAYQLDYREDSVQSDPDLTELRVDTLYSETENFDLEDSTSFESTGLSFSDSTAEETLVRDSLELDQTSEDSHSGEWDQDSLYREVPSYVLNYTYHNDRSLKEADAIKAYFIEKGILEDKIKTHGIARERSEDWEEDEATSMLILRIMP